MDYPKPKEAREKMPREKLLEDGAQTMSDDELVAILMQTGIKSKTHSMDVMTLAKVLVKDFGSKGVLNLSSDVHEVMEKMGLPFVKAATLSAICELNRRAGSKDRAEISSPKDAAEYFADMRDMRKEVVRVACLNAQNLVFYSEMAALGAMDGVECPLIDIFHPPVRFYAQRIIVAHNHPEGMAVASERDKAWHKDLKEMAEKLGIEVVDHLIVAAEGCYSFAEDGKC